MISDDELRQQYGATAPGGAAMNSTICSLCGDTHPPYEMCPDGGDEADENPDEPELCDPCGCDDQDCELCEGCEGCDCCCDCEEPQNNGTPCGEGRHSRCRSEECDCPGHEDEKDGSCSGVDA